MKRVRIQTQLFDSGAELAPLYDLGVGAVASFTGIARADSKNADNNNAAVTAIELEHYPAMTQNVLETLLRDACLRWDLAGGILIHRTGRIETGEAIVLVGTAAAHRAAALEACGYLIDCLKTGAPFWKKEQYSDGSARWVEAKDSDTERAQNWV